MSCRAHNGPNVSIDLPLYDALWKLNSGIKVRFPSESASDSGINALGVMFSKPIALRRHNWSMKGGYWCTPKNVLPFASTGGDGEHFSFLVRDCRIGPNSPIVLTAPCNSGDTNRILADSFQTFLRIGIQRGFFALGQFAYAPQQALQVYGMPDWQPSEKWHYDVGYVPYDRQLKVLAFVADALRIQPFWYSPQEFADLQARWMPSLQMSVEYYGLTGETS